MGEDENRGASHQAAHLHPTRHINDTTFIDTTKLEPDYEHHYNSMTDEEHVLAHLQDVESSFVAPTSPTLKVAGPNTGIDDTYLFDVAPKNNSASSTITSTTMSTPNVANALGTTATVPAHPARPDAESNSQTAPISTAAKLKTNQQSTREFPMNTSTTKATASAFAAPSPAPYHPENMSLPISAPNSDFGGDVDGYDYVHDYDDDYAADATDVTDATSATNPFDSLSSPAAAAAARATSRPISAAPFASTSQPLNDHHEIDATVHSDFTVETPDENSISSAGAQPPNHSLYHSPDHTLYSSLRNSVQRSDHHSSDVAANPPSVDTELTAQAESLKASQRPKFLRSRNASQVSSDSSFLAGDDVESDATIGLGVDYALQSGGAAPAFGLTRNSSNNLSRSISMGSIASGIDDNLDPTRSGPLEPLAEVDSPVLEQSDILTTPKAKAPLNPPTDTVIARHVRNIEVPESLAKEYEAKGELSTSFQQSHKLSDFTPTHGTAARGGRNMTLKEQSSTIERLSKENFDLKLKVMFLSDRLDKLSEEGIKEMISENVELKTSLAVIQRDNKMLRRRVKELEKRHHDDEGRPTTSRSGFSSEGRATPTFGSSTQAYEEEMMLLHEQIEEYVREIERLRSEHMASEMEKRKLVDTVRVMGDRVSERVGANLDRQEEADVWKDLLEQETARREQADDENRRLRDEIFSLKQEMNGSASVGGGMHHTTNIYNVSRKPRPSSPSSRSRPLSGLSGDADPAHSLSQSSTLVDDLRRESEKLRHENAELRREVGAQTSMLTSRHREKERLYQEIEELKLAQRRGGQAPSTLDSLLDRSASRVGANDRPMSRGSGLSRLTLAPDDPNREELENKIAEQRDKVNELKFKNQELQHDLETCMVDIEDAVECKRQADDNAVALQEELENTTNDLIAIQAERDEALQEQAEWETKFADLQEEAQGLVNELEAEADQKTEEIQRLQLDLQDRTDNFEALQEELRNMTESLIRLEDEQAKTQKIMEQLEQELMDAGKELEDLENQLLESNEKTERLGVQLESCQGEIAFLREEQEGDKIRIGDLEAALANAEQIITDERERARELDQQLANERTQRELIASREKEEVQQLVNGLNREASTAKEEARTLRKSLGHREVEATQWKERLMELESNLREALGDLSGTRSSLLQSIASLQRELESTVRELETAKNKLAEKEQVIKQRDGLLESHALESRKLGDLLEKERQAHRNTKNQFETFQRTHHHVSRTATSQETRIMELEGSRASDKRKIVQLETTFKEQVAERNNLLLLLWTRLSSLCGSDWTHGNSLINGRALPSVESISTMLPGFSKNLLAAIKMIESLLGNFQSRIKSIERDLWKEYQGLESHLDARMKKLDRLETLVRSGIASGNLDAQARLSQMETAYRTLKIEHATLQRAHDARHRGGIFPEPSPTKESNSQPSGEERMGGGSPSPMAPPSQYNRESRLPRSNRPSHLETQTSRSSAHSMTRSSSNAGATESGQFNSSQSENSSSRGVDQAQWLLRLRELEYKLKEEREARHQDRAAARQRIHDVERQNNEISAELVRAKRKPGV